MSPCWLGARRGFRQLHGEASFVNWIGETSFVNCHAIKSHRRNFSGRFCPGGAVYSYAGDGGAQKSLSLAHSSRSKLAARASRCRTPLQALARASQAERPSRSPASASRCSCPSPERKVGHAAKLVCPTCDCGAHQQLVDPLDARVGSLHPRDERSSHLEFGWSRPHGANRRCHSVE